MQPRRSLLLLHWRPLAVLQHQSQKAAKLPPPRGLPGLGARKASAGHHGGLPENCRDLQSRQECVNPGGLPKTPKALGSSLRWAV